ncbi:MAG: hypothetical protein L3J35_13330 [Bacteroidales bacterium]|nr:hypothetical protein [Bacteroidales bacterium]
MKPLQILIYISVLSFFSCKSNSQSEIKNFDVTDKYQTTVDTILYMQEMSTYLDTLFLNRYEDEVLKYELIDAKKGITEGQILFLGSSSIRRWYSIKEDLFPLPAINRGFGGSTLPEAIYYFNRLAMPYKPSAIVLYEGDNDVLAPFLTPENILKAFKLFVRMAEKYLPETDIYFLSIKPSPKRINYIDKMLITNMLIKEFCITEKKLHYIDITEPMYDISGNILNNIFQKDKLHMNKKGYEIWAKIIKDALLKK